MHHLAGKKQSTGYWKQSTGYWKNCKTGMFWSRRKARR